MDKTPYTNDDVCAYSYFEVPEIRDYLCNLLSFVTSSYVYVKEELLPENLTIVVNGEEIHLGKLGHVHFSIDKELKTFIKSGPIHFYEEDEDDIHFIGNVGSFTNIRKIIDTLISIKIQKQRNELTLPELNNMQLKFASLLSENFNINDTLVRKLK